MGAAQNYHFTAPTTAPVDWKRRLLRSPFNAVALIGFPVQGSQANMTSTRAGHCTAACLSPEAIYAHDAQASRWPAATLTMVKLSQAMARLTPQVHLVDDDAAAGYRVPVQRRRQASGQELHFISRDVLQTEDSSMT